MPDEVYQQYIACRSEILPGPAHILRWGVPAGARRPNGALLHDDFLLADSLVAVLDRQGWSLSFRSTFVQSSINPLQQWERKY
jgi:hypothetical protein